MRLIGIELLHTFKNQYPDAKAPLEAWEREVEKAEWCTPHDVKEIYPQASLVGNNMVVFNIRGNKYRLLVIISYQKGVVFVEKIGTHKEYDKWKLK